MNRHYIEDAGYNFTALKIYTFLHLLRSRFACYLTRSYPALYSKCLYNITMGTDGIYSANVGYNIATGLVLPNVANLCDVLLNL